MGQSVSTVIFRSFKFPLGSVGGVRRGPEEGPETYKVYNVAIYSVDSPSFLAIG